MKFAVASHFDRLAGRFGDGEFYQNCRVAMTATIAPELARARHILDLGCGNGGFTLLFADAAPQARLLAADISPHMLRATRERLHGNTSLFQADAGHLPLRNASVDLVFCNHVLCFVPALDACVREIARLLKPIGTLVADAGQTGLEARIVDLLRKENAAARLLKRVMLALLTRLLATPIVPTSLRRRIAAMNEQRYRAAFEQAGLIVERRDVVFSTSRAGLFESARARWVSGLHSALQSPADWLMKRIVIGAHDPNETISLHEPVLIGHKPT